MEKLNSVLQSGGSFDFYFFGRSSLSGHYRSAYWSVNMREKISPLVCGCGWLSSASLCPDQFRWPVFFRPDSLRFCCLLLGVVSIGRADGFWRNISRPFPGSPLACSEPSSDLRPSGYPPPCILFFVAALYLAFFLKKGNPWNLILLFALILGMGFSFWILLGREGGARLVVFVFSITAIHDILAFFSE